MLPVHCCRLVVQYFCQFINTKLICKAKAQRVLFERYLKALLIKRLVILQTKTMTSAVLPGLFSQLSFLSHCCFICCRALQTTFLFMCLVFYQVTLPEFYKHSFTQYLKLYGKLHTPHH